MKPINTFWGWFMRQLISFSAILFFSVLACISSANAILIGEVESNNSIFTGQNVNGQFSTGANANIQSAGTIPWVSISATGDNSFDYFAFNVTGPGAGIFDIDFGAIDSDTHIDTELFLFDSAGAQLASNDDSDTANGAAGSSSALDAFLSYNFSSVGMYIIGVGRFNSFFCVQGFGICGSAPSIGDAYVLQISLENPGSGDGNPIPEPATLILLTGGLLGMSSYRRKQLKS